MVLERKIKKKSNNQEWKKATVAKKLKFYILGPLTTIFSCFLKFSWTSQIMDWALPDNSCIPPLKAMTPGGQAFPIAGGVPGSLCLQATPGRTSHCHWSWVLWGRGGKRARARCHLALFSFNLCPPL